MIKQKEIKNKKLSNNVASHIPNLQMMEAVVFLLQTRGLYPVGNHIAHLTRSRGLQTEYSYQEKDQFKVKKLFV